MISVCLDMNATSLDEITDLVIDNLINSGTLPFDKKDQVIVVFENRELSSLDFFRAKIYESFQDF